MKALLEKHKKEIMTATDDVEYISDFSYEWIEFKDELDNSVRYYEKVIGNITAEILMALIVTNWCLCCSNEEDIDIDKLSEICKKIIEEKYS